MDGYELVTRLLPPETTTPMPPSLHRAYDKNLGWPGRPEDEPAPKPPKPHIVAQTRPNRWQQFRSKMSVATPKVEL